MSVGIRVESSADVADDIEIGEGTSIWHLAQVREGAVVGENCVIGRGAYVGSGVRIGNNVKVQNYALIYEPAELGHGVFIGPAVVLTNDVYPRAVDVHGTPKSADDWEALGVTVGDGAAIGARSVVRAGITIGRWALVGAGSVVVKDLPDYALAMGNPARQVGWVGRAGVRLREADGLWLCNDTGERYRLDDDRLVLETA